MTNLPSPARSTCRRVFAASSIFAVAATPFTLAVPAHAADANVIDVYVSDLHRDTPLKDMSVTLVNAATGAPVGAAQTTDINGDVEFTGLPDGRYTAKVAASTTHFERYSAVVEISDDVSYSVDVEVAPKRAQVGELRGAITKNASSVSAEIQIFKADETISNILSGTAQPITYSQAWDSDYDEHKPEGSWNLGDLPVGTYKVLVGDRSTGSTWIPDPNYYWDGWSKYSTSVWVGADAATTAPEFEASFADAATFTVTEEATTAVPRVTLPSTGTQRTQVTGTVTDATGKPIEGIRVELFAAYDYYGEEEWSSQTSAYTKKDGSYTIRGSWTGDHTLRFSDDRGDFKPEFLGDVPASGPSAYPNDPQGPDQRFTLDATNSVTKDASLAAEVIDRSTGLHGIITDDLNRPNDDMYVNVFDLHGNRIDSLWPHRDGRWEVASTRLAPGQYKLEVEGYYDDALVNGWYGGKSYASAATFTVPVTGVTNAGVSKNQRFAEISTAVTLPAIDRLNESDTTVTVYNSRGKPVNDSDGESGERSTFRVAPGTYYLGAEGSRYNRFSAANINGVPFIDQFWKGSASLRNATPIKLGSGATVNINFTLGRTLAATSAPRIVGTPKAGTVLRAAPGAWNVEDDVAFSYTWKRGNTTVSTASTYKVTNADRGQRLTLTVKATDTTAAFAAGSSTVALNVPKLTAAEVKVNQAQAKVNATQAQLAKAKKTLAKAKKAKKKAAVKKAKKKVAQLNKQLKTDKAALSSAQKAAK